MEIKMWIRVQDENADVNDDEIPIATDKAGDISDSNMNIGGTLLTS